MRRIIILLLVALWGFNILNAEPVDLLTAKKVAENFYRTHTGATVPDMNATIEHYKGLNTYYLFTVQDGGFVIVSADDAIIPILGYSFEPGTEKNFFNPNVMFWLDQYNQNIYEIVTKKMSNAETRKEWDNALMNKFEGFSKGVAPLFNITWGQDAGYNTYCPSGTPTGCVATAMGMILRHYQYPATGAGWHKYTHPTYGVQQAYFMSTTYNYSQMPTNTGSQETAKLLYHLGVAVDMNYAPNGSGAFSHDVPYVMANYFKYDQSILYVKKSNYSDANWISLLKNELDNGRPIYYSGTGNVGGHAFLCLGYNDNNYFYFNWGWEGSSNGYYAMGALNPGSMNFNTDNAAVINIKPAVSGEEDFLWVKKYTNFPNQSAYPGYISAVNENVAWSIARDGSGNNANYRIYNVTVDGGATWTSGSLPFGTAFSMIYGLNENTAFIAAYGTGTGNKIIKTTNRGQNWTVVLSGGGGDSFFNVVHFFNENEGYVQGDPLNGYFEIYTTTNGGNDWTRVPSSNIPAPASGEYGITGYYTAVGNTTWFTTNKGNIYKSTNKGNTWTKYQIASVSYDTYIEIAFTDDAQTGLALMHGNNQPTRKYKTVNGGSTWVELTSAPNNFYDQGISAVPGTPNMFVSVGADYQTPKMGISYSMDGGVTWVDYADYYKSQQFVSIAMVNQNKGFAGGFQGAYQGGMWILGGTAALSANFQANKTKACLGEDVVFTNMSVGVYSTITWNFGEGANPATANTAGPHTVTYSTPGAKTITLTISNGNQSATETKVGYVEVVAPPVADFTFTITSGYPNLVLFDASVSTGVITGAKYLWNFGNGVTQTRTIPTTQITYQQLGVYNVTLEVQNLTGGCSDTVQKVVDNRPVGISDEIPEKAGVYPNPATQTLNIVNATGAKYTLYSVEGKAMLTGEVLSENFPLDLSTLSKGIYTIRLFKGNDVTTERIIKQ